VRIDDRDIRGGEKTWQHIKRGVPLRVDVGPRDIASGSVFARRRDQSPKEKWTPTRDEFIARVPEVLDEIQTGLFQRALEMREAATQRIDDLAEFEAFFTPKNAEKPEIHGGLAWCHFVDSKEMEEKLGRMKVTIRCVPLVEEEDGKCIFTGQPSRRRGVFAKAY
jgi:prolyl-tRNA synthetase